jgi:hypothetical protein
METKNLNLIQYSNKFYGTKYDLIEECQIFLYHCIGVDLCSF